MLAVNGISIQQRFTILKICLLIGCCETLRPATELVKYDLLAKILHAEASRYSRRFLLCYS